MGKVAVIAEMQVGHQRAPHSVRVDSLRVVYEQQWPLSPPLLQTRCPAPPSPLAIPDPAPLPSFSKTATRRTRLWWASKERQPIWKGNHTFKHYTDTNCCASPETERIHFWTHFERMLHTTSYTCTWPDIQYHKDIYGVYLKCFCFYIDYYSEHTYCIILWCPIKNTA